MKNAFYGLFWYCGARNKIGNNTSPENGFNCLWKISRLGYKIKGYELTITTEHFQVEEGIPEGVMV
jgi:hypothetical protein